MQPSWVYCGSVAFTVEMTSSRFINSLKIWNCFFVEANT